MVTTINLVPNTRLTQKIMKFEIEILVKYYEWAANFHMGTIFESHSQKQKKAEWNF